MSAFILTLNTLVSEHVWIRASWFLSVIHQTVLNLRCFALVTVQLFSVIFSHFSFVWFVGSCFEALTLQYGVGFVQVHPFAGAVQTHTYLCAQ